MVMKSFLFVPFLSWYGRWPETDSYFQDKKKPADPVAEEELSDA